ncbi:MFS transporter [Alicyclobacillus cycloheptanicus]|uniref:EmrB/QacA subfamily drug resistance transporter n=1 Tax=Alicyclobacillus cycloheptanicus TaxID=1457 RepID=A0ABT9XL40_9BACL|nr:MFS transporter [Alicyclobacillus cycloheptanicus]MDQ0191022.1 EmrB/QacA subfamily drug resistance transporter [Alicyclobacillus cycloheptanicus]WDM00914.1 MFS transporter [Alicyclobacillus cycloheptanicus]
MSSTHPVASPDGRSYAAAPKRRLPLSAVYQRKSYHWYVVGTVCIGAFMAAVDASIVNIALPRLQHDFHATMSTITWVSLVYLLTLAALIIPLGRLADMFGRRWMYASGFTVFMAGSLLCAVSLDLSFLLAARIVQAVGAAMLQANSVSIITAATPAMDRGKAIGIQGSAQAIGLSLGPVIGGALLSFFGWRWIFFVNVPISIFGTLLAILLLPPDKPPMPRVKFDYLGAVTFVPPLVALIYVLNTGRSDGWTSPWLVACGVVMVVGAVAFFLVERKSPHPMVDLSLFNNAAIAMGSITGVLSFALMYAITLLGPFELDHLGSIRAYEAGLCMMVIPLGMTLFTPISGVLADRLSTRILTAAGMSFAILGSALLAADARFVHEGGGYPLLLAGFFLVGAGLGVFTPPNNSSVMGHAPRAHLGVTGSVLNLARTLGMSLGVTLGSLFYQFFLSVHGAANEAHATPLQMVHAFGDAYLLIAVIGLLALVLSVIHASPSRRHHATDN